MFPSALKLAFGSVRLRLTLWYVFVFGTLLVAFSVYLYSLVANDLQNEFDRDLAHAASVNASYFNEFVERRNEIAGASETVTELRLEDLHSAIYREDTLLAASRSDIPALVQRARILQSFRGERPELRTIEHSRLAAMTFREAQARYYVVVLEPLSELDNQLGRIQRIFLLGIPGALLLAAIGGYLLARKSLQPVVQISQETRRIGAENLDQRLSVANPRDEFGHLAMVINELLSRLEVSFRVMRDFVADASHELRTPVAIVHGEADVTLSVDRSPAEYRQSLQVIRKQAERLRNIVNYLLVLARADSRQQRLNLRELYLDDLVEDCCRGAQTMAASNGVTLSCEAERDVSLSGDEELLQRMTINLIENAIRYTPPGGRVSVSLAANGTGIHFRVADTGVGIPPEIRPRVFDRFYRGTSARNTGGHSGLGLSLVKLAAEAHHGTVTVDSEVGRGSIFTVQLPRGAP